MGRVLLEGPGVARMAYRADLERLLADTRPLFPIHTLRLIHRVLQTLAHELGSALTFNQYYTDLTEVEVELSAAAQGLMCRRIPEWLAGASRSERAVARWCDSLIGGEGQTSTNANDSRTPAPTA